jgi:hypothetical protein
MGLLSPVVVSKDHIHLSVEILLQAVVSSDYKKRMYGEGQSHSSCLPLVGVPSTPSLHWHPPGWLRQKLQCTRARDDYLGAAAQVLDA